MIVFVHLLNDRSGSPRVLSSAIAALARRGDDSRLFLGSDGSGILDQVDIPTTRYWYRRTRYRPLTLVTFLFSQLSLLVRLFCTRDIDRQAVIYINTLLPFGAAVYGWLTGRKVIYHLHEVSVSPAPLRWFLTATARRTSQHLIYVSQAHRDCFPIGNVPFSVVHNALDAAFLSRACANGYQHKRNDCFHVLMLASLRDYKGVPEFLALAGKLADYPDIRFYLVVNDSQATMQRYFSAIAIPPNLTVHSSTDDPGPYYARASVVLNLSRPDLWIETFGLTLLEAMSYGIPVIAPPVGGPLELFTDGVQGYHVDSRDMVALKNAVLYLYLNPKQCLEFSGAARDRAAQFSPQRFAQDLARALYGN